MGWFRCCCGRFGWRLDRGLVLGGFLTDGGRYRRRIGRCRGLNVIKVKTVFACSARKRLKPGQLQAFQPLMDGLLDIKILSVNFCLVRRFSLAVRRIFNFRHRIPFHLLVKVDIRVSFERILEPEKRDHTPIIWSVALISFRFAFLARRKRLVKQTGPFLSGCFLSSFFQSFSFPDALSRGSWFFQNQQHLSHR